MNTEQIHGHFRTVKGWALEGWGRVTQDPWLRIAGRREQRLGRLAASRAESRSLAEASFPVRSAPIRERRATR